MFLSKDELNTTAYDFQLEQITDGDDSIIEEGIAAAIEEAEGYLRQNNKGEWRDGRLKYDVDAAFAATGTERSPLLLQRVKSLAIWNILQLCNADMLYDKVKDRYDRAVTWFNRVNKGEITLKLPILKDPDPLPNDNSLMPYRMGSRAKFNYE